MTRLVIFDCDGTLVDSQHAIVAAMTHAFEAVGRSAPKRTSTLSIVGLSLPEAMRSLVPTASGAEIDGLVAAYRKSANALRTAGADDALYDGAAEAVAALAATDGLALGVATGKSHRGVLRMFDHNNWHRHFSTIQTADNNPSKPHPQMILSAISETGATTAQTVMIGDTSFDMAMARAAGVHAIGVTWGYHPRSHLERAGAHVIVDDFSALQQALAAYLGRAHGASGGSP